MSAPDLRTINASLRVVGLLKSLSKDLCVLISKTVSAQPEAKKLVRQIQGLRIVIIEIERLLKAREEDRQNGLKATSGEATAEKGLFQTVRQCRTELRKMKRDFISLRDVRPEEPATTIRDKFPLLLDTDFFKQQQNEIEWQHRAISFEYTVWDHHQRRDDRARNDADRQADRAWVTHVANLLKECRELPPEGPPSGPVSPTSEGLDETGVDLDQPIEAGMPDIDQVAEDSADGEDPIDAPVSQGSQAMVELPESPSREDVEAEAAKSLMSTVKMKNRKTQLRHVKGLLQKLPSKDICVADDDEWTLLHHAVLQENPALLELLLQHSLIQDTAYLNAINYQGHTALMEACKRADNKKGCKMVKLLLDHDCDVNITDESAQERSALYFVVERPPNDYSILAAEALVAKDADVFPVIEGLPERAQGFPKVNEKVERIKQRQHEGRPSRSERIRNSFVGNALH